MRRCTHHTKKSTNVVWYDLCDPSVTMIKNTEWGILFNQNPLRNHQAETLSTKDKGFLPWWFLRGVLVNKIPNKCGFYFYPMIYWIYIFMGNYSCFHIAIYLRFFTSNLVCLNVDLNQLSLNNHLVSKQPQWQCHVTMTWQRGHMTKHILNLAGWGQIRRDQNEWFNHHLGLMCIIIYWNILFMPMWCNPSYK